jgi:hypothetical protein
MAFQAFRNTLTSNMGRQILKAQKHSPVVLLGAGIVGFGATIYLSTKATLKLDGTLVEIKNKIETIKIECDENPEFSDRDRKQAVAGVYVNGALKLVRLYAPAVVVGVGTIVAFTSSHAILNKRNFGLAAVAAGLTKDFKAYRQGVIEEFGLLKDKEFAHGSVEKEVEVEDDKGKITKKKVKVFDPNRSSIYSRVFDEFNELWEPSNSSNVLTLRSAQNYFNDLLQTRGHVFLNEVYDFLRMAHTAEGAQVGWVLNNPDRAADGYVDFGVFHLGADQVTSDFINGWNRSVLLDFNVDGPILHLI